MIKFHCVLIHDMNIFVVGQCVIVKSSVQRQLFRDSYLQTYTLKVNQHNKTGYHRLLKLRRRLFNIGSNAYLYSLSKIL